MDALINEYLPQYLPQLLSFYNTYQPYLAPIYATALHYQSYFFRFVYPTIYPIYRITNYLLTRAISAFLSPSSASSSPTSPEAITQQLIPVLALVIIAFISLRVLDFFRRQIVQWISLVLNMGLWIGMAVIGWWVYQRGVEQSLEDAAWVVGLALGWSEEGKVQGGRMANQREAKATSVRRAPTKVGDNRLPRYTRRNKYGS